MPANFIALTTETVERLRAGEPDANGNPLERLVSDGSGYPCRHCLKDISNGSPMLLLAYRPFPDLDPYAETGPIFICENSCERYEENGGLPPVLVVRDAAMVRGYGSDNRICDGTGKQVATAELEAVCAKIFEHPDVEYIHIRSASNTCFTCRVERAE